MTSKEFERLKAKVEQLKQEKIENEALKKELLRQMRDLGFDELEDMIAEIERLEREKKVLSERLNNIESKLEELLEEVDEF